MAHGEPSCYVEGCRLPECREAMNAYNKQLLVRRARQGPQLVDPAPAVKMLKAAIEAGVTFTEIQQAGAGSAEYMGRVMAGVRKKVQRRWINRLQKTLEQITNERAARLRRLHESVTLAKELAK